MYMKEIQPAQRRLVLSVSLAVTVGTFLGQCIVAAGQASTADTTKLPAPSTQQGVTYNSHIKPIFEQSCVRCHGPERQKASLRLDNLGDVLRGGEDGKVIQPGKSAESRLVHRVAHLGEKDKFMPPPENKAGIPPLTKEQISLIRAWIDQGAK